MDNDKNQPQSPPIALGVAAIVVLLAHQNGDLRAEDYPAFERARGLIAEWSPWAAIKLMEFPWQS